MYILHAIMSSSYFAISLIKRSNLSKDQLAIFLLNVSKEALCDFLNETKLVKKPYNLTKNKIIELIINCDVIKIDDEVNRIADDTERIRIDNA